MPNGDTAQMDMPRKKGFCKVMIGIPAIQDPTWQFVLSSNALAYPPNWTKTTQIAWGREVGDSRCHIVEKAIEAKAEYLLFLDDDVMVPPNLFVKLLS